MELYLDAVVGVTNDHSRYQRCERTQYPLNKEKKDDDPGSFGTVYIEAVDDEN